MAFTHQSADIPMDQEDRPRQLAVKMSYWNQFQPFFKFRELTVNPTWSRSELLDALKTQNEDPPIAAAIKICGVACDLIVGNDHQVASRRNLEDKRINELCPAGSDCVFVFVSFGDATAAAAAAAFNAAAVAAAATVAAPQVAAAAPPDEPAAKKLKTDTTAFSFHATFSNVQRRGGVRGMVFGAAEDAQGAYPTPFAFTREAAAFNPGIFYRDGDLVVDLYFESLQFANQFRNALLAISRLDVLQHGDLPCMLEFEMPRLVTLAEPFHLLWPVLRRHFTQGECGSPPESLSALAQSESHATRADVAMQTFQSLEVPSPVMTMEMIHIIDKSQCKGQRAKYEHDCNKIAGYRLLHNLFDGMSTDVADGVSCVSGVPLIKLNYMSHSAPLDAMQFRSRVEMEVEFFNEVVKSDSMVRWRFGNPGQPGSVQTNQKGGLTPYTAFLYVEHPLITKKALLWSARKIETIWLRIRAAAVQGEPLDQSVVNEAKSDAFEAANRLLEQLEKEEAAASHPQ